MNCPFCKKHIGSNYSNVNHCPDCPTRYSIGEYYMSFTIGKYFVIIDLMSHTTDVYSDSYLNRITLPVKVGYDWDEARLEKLLVLV